MTTTTTINIRVDQLIKDSVPRLDTTEVDAHIFSALKTYNKDKPLIAVKEYSGDSNYDYALPDDWIEGFSCIIEIEYPAGYQIPEILPSEEWIIYQNATAKKIRFLKDSPSAAEFFNLKYTLKHTLTDSASTIYENDEEAFCYLAASLCLQALANYYMQTKDTTIAADVVSYRTKSDEYASMAKEHLKKYLEHIYPKPEVLKAAVHMKEFDTGFLWGGSHLTHPPEWR